MLALTLFGVFFVIALAGVPLLFAILITTTGIIWVQDLGHPLETIFLSFIGGVEPFILRAVPLFIFAGELLAQGKSNLQAPWLGITGFLVIATMLSLLIFIGEAVRDAFDPRKTFK